MSDQSMGLPDSPATGGRSRAIAAHWLPRLQPATAWPAAGLLWGSLGVSFWQDEGDFFNILFTVGVTAALVAFATLLSRRVLFATLLVVAVVAMTVAAASAKRATMNMVVHAYDLFFYF